MVEKFIFNSLPTLLLDIPAVSMPIATLPQNLRHLWPLCCVTKRPHFRMAFYCPQHKVHLRNDRAV